MAIIIIRTLIIYFTLLLMMRLLGKRQLGEMELSEFVVAALVADLAAHPLQDLGIPMINGLVPVFTLFCCEVFISWAAMRSIRLRVLLFGKPGVLIKDGHVVQKEMEKNRFTSDELMQELRNQGCMDISKIKYAILETDGRVNVIKYPEELPVTAKQMKIDCTDTGYPLTVISSGRIIETNLNRLSLDLDWLKAELEKNGIDDAGKVFLMTVNSARQCYMALKEDSK